MKRLSVVLACAALLGADPAATQSRPGGPIPRQHHRPIRPQPYDEAPYGVVLDLRAPGYAGSPSAAAYDPPPAPMMRPSGYHYYGHNGPDACGAWAWDHARGRYVWLACGP